MNHLRKMVRERNGQATWQNASGFSWNQPAEFRFMQVTDSAVLSPVPPGLWFVSEILAFPDAAATDQEWKKAFKEADGFLEVFHQSKVCTVYSSEKKEAFKAYQ